jgi:hypothetical protein
MLDPIMAGRAGLALSHLGQERFFLQLPLIQFCQSLAGANNQVDKEATHIEDRYQYSGGYLQDAILGARSDVTPGPIDES